MTAGKDAANVPSNVQVLILSYNFVQKMVSGGCSACRVQQQVQQLLTLLLCLNALLRQDLSKKFRVGKPLQPMFTTSRAQQLHMGGHRLPAC